jgi:hypothetical protein
MPYFTSWDVNTFLCLVYWGLPDDVVKRMMVATKKTHEEFSLSKAFSYWVSNSPSIVRVCGKLKFIHGLDVCNGWESECRKNIWQNRRNLTIEFKQEWRLRSIEERKAKVIEWCKFGNEQEQRNHQYRLIVRNPSSSYRNDYTKNLWKSWEAGAASYYFVGQNRRNSISKWYEGIHPGRFFLFYRENKIIQERNKGLPKGPCEDGYKYPQTPIYDWGPYEQLIEDLRCIDGPGIGESAGSKIEHIDDLFLD